jgi:diguanylate cyclase (GGDEF)-like protein
MFKIRPISALLVNILLMALSWFFYKAPHGDEYLVLFIIPVFFMAVPVFIKPLNSLFLLGCNIVFFSFYCYRGILNPVDAFVFFLLLAAVLAAGYAAKGNFLSFVGYHDADIRMRQKNYRSIVNELEDVDRRGRMVENELSRISKLYEITKQLVPVLKLEDLVKALFDFIEKNFEFDSLYMLTFGGKNSNKAASRRLTDKQFFDSGEEKEGFDRDRLIEKVKNRDFSAFFTERKEDPVLFEDAGISGDTLMVFPLFREEGICSILVIEGATRSSYSRFRILVPQVTLEFRKVELYERIEELSIIDGLTEVYLRRYLMDRLREEVDRAGRLGLTFSIAMIDVDYFKQCNDNYGHLVGDAVLKNIASRFKNSIREVDMIGRYGGEEFCVVLPETPKKLAVSVAERLRKSIASKKIKAFDENIEVTVSVGVSTYPGDGDSVNAIIEKADTALYKAKRKGRNRVCSA